jgi:tryptophanyl-tRNA synthetase
MSASEPETSIFTMDPPELVKRKIWNAFTGGKGTASEQRKTGADPTMCSIYQYYFFLFEEDDKKLAERERKCKAGETLCGECKSHLVEKLNKFLEEHRRKREKAKDTIEKYHIKR